jgi:hypothetical protein
MVRIEARTAFDVLAHVVGPDSLVFDDHLAAKLFDARRDRDGSGHPTEVVIVNLDLPKDEQNDSAERHAQSDYLCKRWQELFNEDLAELASGHEEARYEDEGEAAYGREDC